jgi:hypothetical protein
MSSLDFRGGAMTYNFMALLLSLTAFASACSVKDQSGSVGQTREQDSGKEGVLGQSAADGKVYECSPNSNGEHANRVCQEIADAFSGHLEKSKSFEIACDPIGSLDHRVVVRDGDGVLARLDGLDRASARRLASDIYSMFPDCTATVVRQARSI